MKRYLTLANLLLVAAACYLGYQVYAKTTAQEAPLTLPLDTPQTDAAPGDAFADEVPGGYRTIVQRNLFNTRTEAAPAPTKVDVEKLELTKLNLKLWGTVVGNGKDPYAVIEEQKGRQQNLYQVGDAVEQATVKMILREKVVLNVNGKDEILEMEKAAGDGAAGRPGQRPMPGIPGSPVVSSGLPGVIGQPSEQNIALNRGQVTEALENANDVIKQVRIRPHFRNGKPDGLSLTGIRPDSIFRKMGLRNGDIISTVNGKDVQTMNDAVEMFQRFGEGDGVEVQIRRRGREQMLKYSLE